MQGSAGRALGSSPTSTASASAGLERGRGGPGAATSGAEGEPEKQTLCGSLKTFARCHTVGCKVGRSKELRQYGEPLSSFGVLTGLGGIDPSSTPEGHTLGAGMGRGG